MDVMDLCSLGIKNDKFLVLFVISTDTMLRLMILVAIFHQTFAAKVYFFEALTSSNKEFCVARATISSNKLIFNATATTFVDLAKLMVNIERF